MALLTAGMRRFENDEPLHNGFPVSAFVLWERTAMSMDSCSQLQVSLVYLQYIFLSLLQIMNTIDSVRNMNNENEIL